MARKFVILIAAATVFFAGCKLSSASSPVSHGSAANASAATPGSVNFKVVSSGIQQGIHSQQLRVITSTKQLSNLVSVTKLGGDKPNVDFSKDELIGVFLGSNLGCGTDGLKISGVKESETAVTVYASRLVSTQSAGSGLALQHPGTNNPSHARRMKPEVLPYLPVAVGAGCMRCYHRLITASIPLLQPCK